MRGGNIPLLESFSICKDYSSAADPQDTIPGMAFSTSEFLRKFSCQDYYFNLDFPRGIAKDITNLDIVSSNTSHSIAQWLGALAVMPEFKCLSITELIRDASILESSKIICLNHLTSFTIRCNGTMQDIDEESDIGIPFSRLPYFTRHVRQASLTRLLALLSMPRLRFYDLRRIKQWFQIGLGILLDAQRLHDAHQANGKHKRHVGVMLEVGMSVTISLYTSGCCEKGRFAAPRASSQGLAIRLLQI